MAFSQETIDQAWHHYAGGKCECTLKNCGHTGRCNKVLDPQNSTPGKNGMRIMLFLKKLAVLMVPVTA